MTPTFSERLTKLVRAKFGSAAAFHRALTTGPESIDVSDQTVRYWMSGERSPNLAHTHAIDRILGAGGELVRARGYGGGSDVDLADLVERVSRLEAAIQKVLKNPPRRGRGSSS